MWGLSVRVHKCCVCVSCACCVRHARACACVWCEHRAWMPARARVRTAAPAFASWLRRACHCSHARRSLVGSSGDDRQARVWAAVLPAAGSAGCGSGAKGLLPGGATPRPSQVGDGMPLSKAAASSATSHSHEGHRVKADVGRVHRVCHRPVRRADRGSPRACIDDQWSDREGGAHPATRGCEAAGHGGPSASLAPCVRVRAHVARHSTGPWPPGEGPTQRLHVLKGVSCGEQGCRRSRRNHVVWDVIQPGRAFSPFLFFLATFALSI